VWHISNTALARSLTHSLTQVDGNNACKEEEKKQRQRTHARHEAAYPRTAAEAAEAHARHEAAYPRTAAEAAEAAEAALARIEEREKKRKQRIRALGCTREDVRRTAFLEPRLFPNTALTHSLTRSLTYSLTQTSGGETGAAAAQADAATVLLAISTKALPNPTPFEVIQANHFVKTDALLCFEWSFREWQGVDRLLWPKDLRTALLDYSKYVQCLMELNETEDPLLHFNEASGYGQYIHKSSVKTFATHIENDFLLCLPSCSEGPTNPEIENAGAKFFAQFFVCALAASTYQAPLAFPPHRLNDC